MLTNTIIYIVGAPGIGKYTIGRLLADALNCKLIDNHHWLNVIFSLVEQDGVTPLPKAIWPLVGEVRDAVLQTIATLSPGQWSFIFTHAALDDPDEMPVFETIRAVAVRRAARLVVVRLTCRDPEELARRVAMPERRIRLKEANTIKARANARRQPLDPGHPETICVETSTLSPQHAAALIIDAIKAPPLPIRCASEP